MWLTWKLASTCRVTSWPFHFLSNNTNNYCFTMVSLLWHIIFWLLFSKSFLVIDRLILLECEGPLMGQISLSSIFQFLLWARNLSSIFPFWIYELQMHSRTLNCRLSYVKWLGRWLLQCKVNFLIVDIKDFSYSNDYGWCWFCIVNFIYLIIDI